MTPLALAAHCKAAASRLGFDACGITSADPLPHASQLDDWLGRGLHGEMGYMARQSPTRKNPRVSWAEAQSIVVVLHNYYSSDALRPAEYRTAKYAQGEDYHRVTKQLLDRLGTEVRTAAGGGEWRTYVDAGPMPERELAQRAGLGWIAKNTMLINPGIGSFTFIGVALTDLELAHDVPFEADRCGTCRRCLDACPTDAFEDARVLDARRCISYLTIESRSDIPAALRSDVGDWLFGCDVCQDVCPWNERFAAPAKEPAFAPRDAADWPRLEEIERMDETTFDRAFGDTALERTRLAGLKRNARVVRENASQL